MFNGSVYFPSRDDENSSSPSPTLPTIHQSERKELLQQKSINHLKRSDTIDEYIKIRKKEALKIKQQLPLKVG